MTGKAPIGSPLFEEADLIVSRDRNKKYMRDKVEHHRQPVHGHIVTIIALAVLLLTTACGEAAGSSAVTTTPPVSTPTPTTAGVQTQTPPTIVAKASPTAQQSKPKGPVKVETRVLVTGLNIPWGLVFLPDGRALVTERASGMILAISPDGKVEEVQKLPSNPIGEGGLLGITISPNYATDRLVYAYYSTAQDNRVVRFRLGEQPRAILTGIPVAGNHNGGRIAFGPDGMLYVGTGDGANRPNSQNLNSLGGKILRMTPDGKVPPGNPFPDSLVYSYGHRNVQGLAWNTQGQLYASEFGQNQFDEVNRIVPGKNYGWPIVEGEGGDKRFVEPVTTFQTSEASPSGATFLKGGAIPQWEGNLFVAGLRGQRLWRLTFGANGVITNREPLLLDQFGRLRHVVQAPDGSLWILTNNRDGRGSPVASDDRILRIGPARG
jgi:glucose/arabinose dehydrogenase